MGAPRIIWKPKDNGRARQERRPCKTARKRWSRHPLCSKRGAWMPKNKRKPEQQENQGTEDGPHPSSREESIAVARGARYNPKIKLVAPLARYFMEA